LRAAREEERKDVSKKVVQHAPESSGSLLQFFIMKLLAAIVSVVRTLDMRWRIIHCIDDY
jgi:hypothetical protein